MEPESRVMYATGLTVEQMKGRVRRGFLTERNLLRLAWFILGLAIAGLVTVLALWMLDEISVDQMLAAVFGVIMSSILSGAATYGSGINVGLAASRLATNLPPEVEEQDAAERAGARRDAPEPVNL
jgi:hypothetical protein